MARNYSPKEFVKVYRKLLNWEWYGDANTEILFIHCLLKANWKAGSWKGISYEAGEFITSLASLAEETGLSIQQTRTALSHLESTGEVTSILTNRATGRKLTKNRIIAINNWNEYQGSNKQSNKQSTSKATAEQQATNKQTNNSIRKEELKRTKEEKEEPAALSPPEEDIDWDSVEWVDLSAMNDEEYAAWEEKQRGKGAI